MNVFSTWLPIRVATPSQKIKSWAKMPECILGYKSQNCRQWKKNLTLSLLVWIPRHTFSGSETPCDRWLGEWVADHGCLSLHQNCKLRPASCKPATQRVPSLFMFSHKLHHWSWPIIMYLIFATCTCGRIPRHLKYYCSSWIESPWAKRRRIHLNILYPML